MASRLNNLAAFHQKLAKADRILAICGAGLSAASGLPTFRGAGGLWRNYEATDLATPEAFAEDPGLVWLFYAYRRHMALQTKPSAGHHALAALAKKRPNFLCLTQNVDNLSPRAGHPASQLRTLHGSLFTLKCSSPSCSYVEPSNTSDPLCPSLAPASVDPPDPSQPGKIPLLDPSHPLPTIQPSSLPQCPRCASSGTSSLLRPGVVWFGESLDPSMLSEIDAWIDQGPIDLILVVGTSSVVYPAAGYAERARTKGHTSVVTVNKEVEKVMWRKGEDLAFQGGAEEWLGRMLEPVIGGVTPGIFNRVEDGLGPVFVHVVR
ncbi:DHS-like NAD/FAD-binding domain-containing protein [Neurospora tetraspora]|uniref:DHS-like NAD/FAD-binding domain-containing protein n=1 Tax=Neurospora tetraspora TaxID=94610 RepID=A0AAE0JDC4_9PEZI|nr:DHS-like NAD/FAD-binding domain-containing protein [Neurospora tetraspora]